MQLNWTARWTTLVVSFTAAVVYGADPLVLWHPEKPVPKAAECPRLQGVEFVVVKPREPDNDGYNWLHGAAVCWHGNRLYASFGHNKGSENTATEEARGRLSTDGGKTWGEVFTIDVGDEPNLAVSHGVFLSHRGKLWAFHGSFYGRMKTLHTRAYVLDEASGTWEKRGVVARDGFWPTQEPLAMDDGNWLMAGISVANGYGGPDDPAAVAISHGDDFTKWDVVVIPKPAELEMWGESTVIVEGAEVLCIARWKKPVALAAVSRDFGRTWTEVRETNLPMAASKPYAGVLSTGQRYLICTTTADSGNRRSPLTIAVSRPGERVFAKVYRIRDAVYDGPGESGPNCRLAYPYAVEHAGKLYVVYSNDGGRGANRNSAELAIIPVESLRADEPEQRAEPQAEAPTERMDWIRPSDDGTHFVRAASGRRIVMWGVNYDHDEKGRLIEDYWHSEWATVAADFAEIKALGANVVRVHLQLAKFMDTAEQPNAANLARLGELVRLAERTGLYLDLTGLGCYHKQDVPPWYDALDAAARWDVQARFWRAVAGACKNSPAVFCYDLMNEPILPGKKKETEWLTGELGGKYFVQRIALDLAGRTRIEMARDWVRKLTGAIREVDRRHMITIGVIPWAVVFKGAKPLFYAPEVSGPLDFVSVHFYPKKGELEATLEALAVYDVGKPLVIEEIFPLKAGLDETAAFIDRSRKHADGWLSFYWGATIEENEAKGDLKGAIVAKWLRYWREHAPPPKS